MGAREPTTSHFRLALVGGVRIHREGLHKLLRDERGIEVVASVPTAEEVSSSGDKPEFVLLDARPPDCFVMASAVQHAVPGTNVVAIGLEESDELAEACSRTGICWYLTPQASTSDLVSAVSAISSGAMPCSPQIAAALFRQASGRAREQEVDTGLTYRELEILDCLRSGLTNKMIARRLGIRLATVKNHVHNILAKLHAKNRSDAASRPSTGSFKR